MSLSTEFLDQYRTADDSLVTAFAQLIVVANEQAMESGAVSSCLRERIDALWPLMSDRSVSEIGDAMMTAYATIDGPETRPAYDTAYPIDWAQSVSVRTNSRVEGVFWLYRKAYSGPVAYNKSGLKVLQANRAALESANAQ